MPENRRICAAAQLVAHDGWPAPNPVGAEGWAGSVEVV
jgi:hypothetical protein